MGLVAKLWYTGYGFSKMMHAMYSRIDDKLSNTDNGQLVRLNVCCGETPTDSNRES